MPLSQLSKTHFYKALGIGTILRVRKSQLWEHEQICLITILFPIFLLEL